MANFRVAEFFAGMGLVRRAVEDAGGVVVFANDIEPFKARLYGANFDARDLVLGDVRGIRGTDVPDVDLATASFPCTDVSLAGKRRGLAGEQSGMFWEFARVIEEMAWRGPPAILLENVPSLLTSHGGRDLAEIIERLNQLEYTADLVTLDARWFVPQSRQRLFVVALRHPLEEATRPNLVLRPATTALRPSAIHRFAERHPSLDIRFAPIREPSEERPPHLRDLVEELKSTDPRWWGDERIQRFLSSLSGVQAARLQELRDQPRTSWATAYRRTRKGRAVWEVRADEISGCLRTARGGSSKQALVQAGKGRVMVRWMLAVEYARLQGANNLRLDSVSENQALFALGDAVCVPAVAWLIREYVARALEGEPAHARIPATA